MVDGVPGRRLVPSSTVVSQWQWSTGRYPDLGRDTGIIFLEDTWCLSTDMPNITQTAINWLVVGRMYEIQWSLGHVLGLYTQILAYTTLLLRYTWP